MSCTLIEKIGTLEGLTFGVLDTPCFPKKYYGGVIKNYLGNWDTTDHGSCNYFQNQSDAYLHATQLFEKMKFYAKSEKH